MHIMVGSYYAGKPVSDIPFMDVEHFASYNQTGIKRLLLLGWSDEDVQAVKEEYKRRVDNGAN